MWHSFFQFSSKVKVLIFLFTLFQFYSVVSQDSKIHNSASSLFFFFFLLIITRSGRLAVIWWSVCISKSQRSLCVAFSRTDSGLSIYHLFVWPNFNFWHNIVIIQPLACFSTPVLNDGFSPKFEWRQISSGPLDSFKYFKWFWRCCGLDGFDLI